MSRQAITKDWYARFERVTEEAVRAMLDLAEVRPGEMVYDIGCGYGGILLEAQRRGARVAGVSMTI